MLYKLCNVTPNYVTVGVWSLQTKCNRTSLKSGMWVLSKPKLSLMAKYLQVYKGKNLTFYLFGAYT